MLMETLLAIPESVDSPCSSTPCSLGEILKLDLLQPVLARLADDLEREIP